MAVGQRVPAAGTTVGVLSFILTRPFAIFNLSSYKVGLKGQAPFTQSKREEWARFPESNPKVSFHSPFPGPGPTSPPCLSARVPEVLAHTINWKLVIY